MSFAKGEERLAVHARHQAIVPIGKCAVPGFRNGAAGRVADG